MPPKTGRKNDKTTTQSNARQRAGTTSNPKYNAVDAKAKPGTKANKSDRGEAKDANAETTAQASKQRATTTKRKAAAGNSEPAEQGLKTSADRSVIATIQTLQANMTNAMQETRNDIENFRTEFHTANIAHKFELRPGEYTTHSNRVMLVVPTGKPPLSQGIYSIGYDKRIKRKGLKGEWKFMSAGCSGSEESNARARFSSKGYPEAEHDGPTAQEVHDRREAENEERHDDGITSGIIIVWVPTLEQSSAEAHDAEDTKKTKITMKPTKAVKSKEDEVGIRNDESDEDDEDDDDEIVVLEKNLRSNAPKIANNALNKSGTCEDNIEPHRNQQATIPGSGHRTVTRQMSRQASVAIAPAPSTSVSTSYKRKKSGKSKKDPNGDELGAQGDDLLVEGEESGEDPGSESPAPSKEILRSEAGVDAQQGGGRLLAAVNATGSPQDGELGDSSVNATAGVKGHAPVQQADPNGAKLNLLDDGSSSGLSSDDGDVQRKLSNNLGDAEVGVDQDQDADSDSYESESGSSDDPDGNANDDSADEDVVVPRPKQHPSDAPSESEHPSSDSDEDSRVKQVSKLERRRARGSEAATDQDSADSGTSSKRADKKRKRSQTASLEDDDTPSRKKKGQKSAERIGEKAERS